MVDLPSSGVSFKEVRSPVVESRSDYAGLPGDWRFVFPKLGMMSTQQEETPLQWFLKNASMILSTSPSFGFHGGRRTPLARKVLATRLRILPRLLESRITHSSARIHVESIDKAKSKCRGSAHCLQGAE